MARILLSTCYKGEKTYQVGPPLGILYLGATLLARKHKVRVCDLRVNRENPNLIFDTFEKFCPDVIGLSAVHNEVESACAIARKIKSSSPKTTVVIGGPVVTSALEYLRDEPAIDFAVKQEGENTIASIVEKSSNGLPGVYSRINGKLEMQNQPQPIDHLDDLPLPAWDLLPMAPYHHAPRHGFLAKRRAYYSVYSSRGCPYSCSFCQNQFGRKYRFRSAENVLDEVEILVRKYGIEEIHFPDDCFNLKKERALKIFDGILRRGLKIAITFPSGLRGDLLDREFLTAAKKAGVYKIPFGIESGSPRIQKLINKNLDLEKIRRNIALAADLGIITQGFFILGFPTETEAELAQTASFAQSTKLHFATFNWANAFPGTAMYEWAKSLGKPVDKVGPEQFDFDDPPVPLADIPQEKMQEISRLANGGFYLDPIRLLRILWAMPSKGQLFLLATHFLKKVFFNLRKRTGKIS